MLRAVLLAAVVLAVLPAQALAGNVQISDGRITYTPGVNTEDNMSLRDKGGFIELGVSSQPSATFPCVQTAQFFTVTCPKDSIQGVTLNLADNRDDVLVFETGTDVVPFSLPVTVDGGSNNDRLMMGSEPDVLNGLDGFDTLLGRGGQDILRGDDDADLLDGGPGNDTIEGGDDGDLILPPIDGDLIRGGLGIDTLQFGPNNDAVTLDGLANDGTPGQGANVSSDVETIEGAEGADSMVGDANANTFRGGPGADTLDGRGGADQLEGGPDGDDLHGGTGVDRVSYTEDAAQRVTLDDLADDGAPGEHDNVHGDIENVAAGLGNDTLIGNAGDNVLDGGAGDDELRGGAGVDTLLGGPGNDTILARDGEAEAVDCGAEGGSATVDTIDTVANCTHVDAGDELLPDHDHDGVDRPPRGPDCNDRNAAIHPGAPEILNNAVDENCDGRADFDRDGDGFVARPGGRDCDDTNARIHPGARERPGNKADEDCDGHADPFPLLGSALGAFSVTDSHGTRFTDFFVRHAAKGSTIRLRCSGAGCGRRTRTVKVRRDRRTLKLVKLVRHLELRPGARLEVRITKRATIGALVRFTMRRGKAPARRDDCLFPGTRRPHRCPG